MGQFSAEISRLNGSVLSGTQHNGHPAVFAALARALSIPFLAVFDGDQAGNTYCDTIRNRGFDPAFVADRCKTLPNGNLEQQLLADGLEGELRSVLQELGQADAPTIDEATLEKRLDGNKTAYAAALSNRIATDPALAQRMPQAFRDAIGRLRGLE
jgi:putative ATP-dependent endonuclease of OLD family